MRDNTRCPKNLSANGYILENSKLIDAKTQEPFVIEFLISDRQEKYALNYRKI